MPEVLYTAIIRSAKLGMRALGQPIDITGLEHLPRTGPALLAVNHVGYVDFIYGGVAPERIGRRVRFMAKRELFDHKVSGPIMRACRHIAVDRAEGEASNRQVVETLLAAMGRDPGDYDLVSDRPGHDRRYAVDSSKLRAELGWQPRYGDFAAGLAATVDWYREHEGWWRKQKAAAEAKYAVLGR